MISVKNGKYQSVAMVWGDITLPLKAGTPVSLSGAVANTKNAIGIVPQTYTKRPLMDSIYILVGGAVDKTECEAAYGSSYTTAAIQAMDGIEFYYQGTPVKVSDLPSVTGSDNGKVLTVSGGKWVKAELPESGGFLKIGITTGESAVTLDKTWQEIHDAFVAGYYCSLVDEQSDGVFSNDIIKGVVETADTFIVTFESFGNFVTDSASGYPSQAIEEESPDV